MLNLGIEDVEWVLGGSLFVTSDNTHLSIKIQLGALLVEFGVNANFAADWNFWLYNGIMILHQWKNVIIHTHTDLCTIGIIEATPRKIHS